MNLLYLAVALGLIYGVLNFWPASPIAKRVWAVVASVVAVLLIVDAFWPGTIE
jgi:hypothetical protein